MQGAPDYKPGDLIAALGSSRKYPIKKGQVVLCKGLRAPSCGHGIWGVWIEGHRADPRTGTNGAFRALAFRKVDPLPPAFFTGDVDVDVDLSADEPVRECV